MIKTDCVNFPLDRPCKAHKSTGIKCSSCRKYRPFNKDGKGKILVIKLGAMGDVLRTTFILEGLKNRYPKCRITWIVAKGSESVLEGNPYIDRIWPFDLGIFKLLVSEKFDTVINLDLSPESLSLAGLAFTNMKIGYWIDESRRILCSNNAAKIWLEMSGNDRKKKENKHTYQYWMSKIIGLKRSDYEIFVPLRTNSVRKAKVFLKKHGLRNGIVVGINPGAGKRWRLKKWTDRGFIEIINRLSKNKIKVLLFGGPEEKNLIKKLVRKTGNRAISTGTDNSIPDFFALLDLCDIVICGDTLALHAALGLKKKVIAIFGPTSAPEIEMYDRGRKVVSPASCVCCYDPLCKKHPTCMDRISAEIVWNSFQTLLKE